MHICVGASFQHHWHEGLFIHGVNRCSPSITITHPKIPTTLSNETKEIKNVTAVKVVYFSFGIYFSNFYALFWIEN